MIRPLRAFFFAAVLCAPALGRAQETQVSLDSAGKIDKVDRALAEQIGMFVDKYPDFKEATLYETSSVAGELPFVLEVLTETGGKVSRRRVQMTAAEVEALRREVTAAIAARAPTVGLNQEGRGDLLVASVVTALGLYSWSVPVALDMSGAGGTALGLGIVAGSFFVPWILTADAPVTEGVASLASYGLGAGIINGAAFAALLGAEDFTVNRFALLLTAFSVGEGIAGYQFARRLELADGHAHFMGAASTLATLAAVELGFLAGGGEFLGKPLAATILVGGYGGYALGYLLAPSLQLTMGDAEVLRGTGLLGMGLGFAIGFALLSEATTVEGGVRLLTGLALAGGVGGGVLGNSLITGADFTASQALFGYLGALGGAMLGSIPLLFGNIGARFALLLPMSGASLGYLLVMNSYVDEAQAASRAAGHKGASSLQLDLNPIPLLARVAGGGARGPEREALLGAPVLSVRMAF